MLSKEDNDLLCRVGPGTPMGELMRRYWLPVIYSWEMEPDGQPQKVRILGEDLIAFRGTDGRCAFVQEYCPHRGVNLYFGRNEECGIRCAYHGWKFDVEGNCVDMPNEPGNSVFKSKVKITAYKTAESGGLVWVYMGQDQDNPPPLPQFEWMDLPETHVSHTHKLVYECNWMQALEGELDTTHVFIMHSRLKQEIPGKYGLWIDDLAARLAVVPTEYGIMYGGERSEPDGSLYWRTTQFLFPFYGMFPAVNMGTVPISIYVPIDDEHTLHLGLAWNPANQIEQNTPEGLLNAHLPEEPGVLGGIGPMKPEQKGRFFARWWPAANRENDFHMDLDAKKSKSFTGIPGVRLQDEAVIWSMGSIMPRYREHLGTADATIIAARRSLLAAAKELQENGTPPPASTKPELYRVRPCETVLPAAADWQEALGDWLNCRTTEYPGWDIMVKRWNRGGGGGVDVERKEEGARKAAAY
jgi:nitrite reductase/ring-hydroxylating ferredoxin subunit